MCQEPGRVERLALIGDLGPGGLRRAGQDVQGPD